MKAQRFTIICGFVRERGTLRTSTTRSISEAKSNSMNSPIERVE